HDAADVSFSGHARPRPRSQAGSRELRPILGGGCIACDEARSADCAAAFFVAVSFICADQCSGRGGQGFFGQRTPGEPVCRHRLGGCWTGGQFFAAPSGAALSTAPSLSWNWNHGRTIYTESAHAAPDALVLWAGVHRREPVPGAGIRHWKCHYL